MVFRFGVEGEGILIGAPSFHLAKEKYSEMINDLNDGIQDENRKLKETKNIKKIS